MTVLDVLTAATGYLEKHHVESPRLNAEHLLAHVLGKKRLDLYMEFDRPLSEQERAPLRDLIRSRGTGHPLQHLLGTAEFFGRSFLCDARALIPRPETEELVELAQETHPPPARILDIGTGSGILAITLALKFPTATVEAVDISPDALALARENATRHAAVDRITFHQADLLPSTEATYDLIVANLPYIPTDDLAGLQREVRFDPSLALDGGPDGLDLVKRLIATALAKLAPAGRVALEIGQDQAQRVAELFRQSGYVEITITRDLQGVERFVSAAKP